MLAEPSRPEASKSPASFGVPLMELMIIRRSTSFTLSGGCRLSQVSELVKDFPATKEFKIYTRLYVQLHHLDG
jgi:hypothetical protein